MQLRIFVPEGEELPRGYGLAWREFNRPGAICMPMPFNRIARAARQLFIWIRLPRIAAIDHYDYGYERGFADAMSIYYSTLQLNEE